MIREPRAAAVAYSFWLRATALALGFVNGEARAEQPLKFEVASVKPSGMQDEDCDLQPDQGAEGSVPCHHVGGGKGSGLHANGPAISDVALNVANSADRQVIDSTGLKDFYRGELA